ncbi:MAG: hypothetical protein DMG13_08915 [Acidobacteria bacterium]|nr:MAG: hypothetical protein DMG13_08915 [Acidobacteriota bacterium]
MASDSLARGIKELQNCEPETRQMVSTVGAVYDRALFLTSGAKGRICDEKRAVIGAVNKLESSVIPLLARPQGGVAASSRKFRAATEADAAGVVFHLFSSENHPGLAVSGGFAIILDRSATPPCGDARRGIALFQFFHSSIDRAYS